MRILLFVAVSIVAMSLLMFEALHVAKHERNVKDVVKQAIPKVHWESIEKRAGAMLHTSNRLTH
jgi:hypothetical protein